MPEALLSLQVPVVVAHRGGAALRPENTLTAFDHAVSLGVDAIECDVRLSRDGHVVVIHDPTVDRTTDGRGAVAGLTAAELAALDAGWGFRDPTGRPTHRGQGVTIPRLTDVFDRFPALPIVVEIKGDDPAIVPPVLDVIRRHGREQGVIVGGFSRRVLAAVRDQAPGIVTSASSAEVRAALHRSWFWLAPRPTGCRLFQMPYRYGGRRILTRRLTQAVRKADLPVHAWVLDDPGEIRTVLGWGVTGIITDRPDLARVVLATRR